MTILDAVATASAAIRRSKKSKQHGNHAQSRRRIFDQNVATAFDQATRIQDFATRLPDLDPATSLSELDDLEHVHKFFAMPRRASDTAGAIETVWWQQIVVGVAHWIRSIRGTKTIEIGGLEHEVPVMQIRDARIALGIQGRNLARSYFEVIEKIERLNEKNLAFRASQVELVNEVSAAHPRMHAMLELVAFLAQEYRASRGHRGGYFANELRNVVVQLATSIDIPIARAEAALLAADEAINRIE